MPLSRREAAIWVFIGLAVVAIAFWVGSATATRTSTPEAQAAEAPHGVHLSQMGRVAGLPALHEEAESPAVEFEAEEAGEGEVVEGPSEEFSAPPEASEASPPSPSSPSPSGSGGEVVPEGL